MGFIRGIHLDTLYLQTDAPSKNQGGVAVFYRLLYSFQVGVHHVYGPNISIFQLVLGGRKSFYVGFNLKPNKLSTIERIISSISQHPHGSMLLVAGDFNADLDKPEGQP